MRVWFVLVSDWGARVQAAVRLLLHIFFCFSRRGEKERETGRETERNREKEREMRQADRQGGHFPDSPQEQLLPNGMHWVFQGNLQ